MRTAEKPYFGQDFLWALLARKEATAPIGSAAPDMRRATA